MKILALETSAEIGSVALLVDGQLLSRQMEGASSHSANVLSLIAELLATAELRPEKLDAIAFGCGPGAFTGVRLACGVAQGLGLATDVPLAAVGSLDAIALQAAAANVFVATDARMGEVYCAAFERDGQGLPQALSAPLCLKPEAVELPPGSWVGAGSAFARWPQELGERLQAGLAAVRGELAAGAEEVARIAISHVAQGRLLAPEQAAPLYVRDKVAFTTAERLARGGKA